jgi:hypothetical protein
MLNRVLRSLANFARQPYVQLVVAIVLIVSSAVESWQTMAYDFTHLQLRVHHGTLLLGISQLLSCLPQAVDGLERMAKAKDL